MKKYLFCLTITNIYKICLKKDCNVSITHIWQHMLDCSNISSTRNIVTFDEENQDSILFQCCDKVEYKTPSKLFSFAYFTMVKGSIRNHGFLDIFLSFDSEIILHYL